MDKFAVETLGFTLNENRLGADGEIDVSKPYLTTTGLSAAKASINAGGLGAKGTIQVGQKYDQNNLGGYLTEENEFPTYSFLTEGADLVEEMKAFYDGGAKSADYYSNHQFFYVKETDNEYTLWFSRTNNENDIKSEKYPLLYGLNRSSELATNAIIYTDVGKTVGDEGSVHIMFFTDPDANDNNKYKKLRTLRFGKDNVYLYTFNDYKEAGATLNNIKIEDIPNAKSVKINNLYAKRLFSDSDGAHHNKICLILKLEGEEKRIFLGGLLQQTYKNNYILKKATSTPPHLAQSNNACVVETGAIRFEKKQTEIQNIINNYIPKSIAFGVYGKKEIIEKNKYFSNLHDIMNEDDHNNGLFSPTKNAIGFIYLKFKRNNDEKIILYKINNKIKEFNSFNNVYQTIIPEANFTYSVKVKSNYFNDIYITSFFNLKEQNQKKLNLNDVIFMGCNENESEATYSNYWADNTSSSQGTDLVKSKRNERSGETIPLPGEIIRYYVKITKSNGEISEDSGVYNNISWIYEQYENDPTTGSKYSIGKYNYPLDSLEKNSEITNPNPNVHLNAFETIFKLGLTRNVGEFYADPETKTNDVYGGSGWAAKSIKTVETNGRFDKNKFRENTDAISWVVNKVEQCEGIVYFDPTTRKPITEKNTGYAKFYTDNLGVLTVGHGITWGSGSSGDTETDNKKTEAFKAFAKLLNDDTYTIEKDSSGNDIKKSVYKCLIEDGQYKVRDAKTNALIKSKRLFENGVEDKQDASGNYICAIPTSLDDKLVEDVVISKISYAHSIYAQGSRLNYTLGQIVTLGAILYNGGGNITAAGTSARELKSNKTGWEKFVKAEKRAIKLSNGNTIYMHESADEIANFHFYAGETEETSAAGKPANGKVKIEITCYAKDLDGWDGITISTFFKDQLFEKNDETGKYTMSAPAFKDYTNAAKGFFKKADKCCLFTYLVPQKQLDDAAEADAEASQAKEMLPYSSVREFVKKFSACIVKTTGSEEKKQEFIDVDGYYDFYSGMTPYIIAGFRDKTMDGTNYNYNYIDSISHPYFVSLKVEDNGVKTIQLQLFDKDFGSYQKGILFSKPTIDISKNSNGTEAQTGKSSYRVYSLENLIRGALATPVGSNTEESNSNMERYSEDNSVARAIEDEFLKFSEAKNYSPTNLKIRFGYADKNLYVSNKDTSDENKGIYNTYYQKKGVSTDERNYRWWDVSTLLEDESRAIKLNNKYLKKQSDDKFQDKSMEIKNAERGQTNNIGSSVAAKVKEESNDQTTKMSYFIDCMITGYKTSLQNNGILYTITAVETKEARLMKTRFLQRFATFNSYPEEVLYGLMKLFNEDINGNNIKSCPIKLYLLENEEAPEAYKYELVQNLDLSKLTDEEKKDFSKAVDATGEIDTISLLSNDVEIKPEWLKKINLSFGGQAALSNYNGYVSERSKPLLYKNVYSLLNEFCAACPPFKPLSSKREEYTTTNINGEQVTVASMPEVARRLAWFSIDVKEATVEDKDKNGYIAVFFYYRKPEKVKRIRRYTWGPENFNQTVITSLNIENANEFAVMSGVESFDANSGKVTTRTNEGKVFKRIENDKEIRSNAELKVFDGVTASALSSNNYDAALASCMYKGTIQIMGDPFYLFFGTNMQPCTYPIYLRVLVPKSEFERRAYDSNGEDYNEIKSQKSVFGERKAYGNQQLHEMSGYYVISKITHEINAAGFTTTLEVMSYPGIDKDIIEES